MTQITGTIYLESAPDTTGWVIKMHDCPTPVFNELTQLLKLREYQGTQWVSLLAQVTIFKDWRKEPSDPLAKI